MKFKSSDAFHRSLFENLLDGLAYCQMVFDAQGHPSDFIYLEVNQNFEKLTGLKDVVGKKVTKIIPNLRISNPELFEIYSRVALTRKSERFEIYIEQLSKWLMISVYSPKKNFFIVVFQNITNHKQAEKNFEEAKIAAQNVLEDLNIEKMTVELAAAKEKAILLSIGDGLITTDEKGNIILINKTAEKLLGVVRNKVMKRGFYEAISIEDEKGVPVPIDKRPINIALANATNTTTSGTYFYIRPDKTKFPVAVTVAPVLLYEKVIGTIEVFRDITREKAIDLAKTEFISLASHQLRTPLTTISWYTEMILNGDVGSVAPDQKKYLKEIYNGNRRMIDLVNAILNISRIELGTFLIEPVFTDVALLMKNIMDEQKSEIDKKNMKFSSSFEKDIFTILVDPKLLRMVVENLLINAMKYTPEGGKIDISLFLDKTRRNVEIKVSDTGYGIPKDEQGKIFSKFFRASNVKDKDTEGTGLGLYIIKSIIENSGGQIWFESEENKGTIFYVTFPLVEVKNKKDVKQLA